jgi:hypothetical protein
MFRTQITKAPAPFLSLEQRLDPNPRTIREFIAFSDALGQILDGIPGVAVLERRFGWSGLESGHLATFTDYRVEIEEGRSARNLWRARPLSSLGEITRILERACGIRPELVKPDSLFYVIGSAFPVTAEERAFKGLSQALGVSLMSASPMMGSSSFHKPATSPAEFVEYFERCSACHSWCGY